MPYDPERDHRRSIRLKGYDYRTPGLYVVTMCTQYRASLLGAVVAGEMHPSPAGLMAQTVWNELPWAYPGIEIDAFVVMPNRVHGIVYLVPDKLDEPRVSGPEASVGEQGQAQGPAPTGDVGHVGATPGGCPSPEKMCSDSSTIADAPRRLSLPDVVHRFKTLTTTRYGDGVRRSGWPPYDRRLWQRN